MIEIDRESFVACRLCVFELGDYQIVPSIQQEIKFCYDIEINPFDGLPQLICKKCVSTLSKFAAIKNDYVDKQKNIRHLLKEKIAKLTKDEINSEQETISVTPQLSSIKEIKKKKKLALHSDSSDDSSSNSSLKAAASINKKKDFKRIKKQEALDFSDTNYDKLFICRFCNKGHKSKSSITKHIKIHSSMLCKYQTYAKGNCYVRLNRMGDKTNIFNSKNIVVHSRDRCVKSEHEFYYSVFKLKSLENTKNKQNSSIFFEKVAKTDPDSSSEISDSGFNLKKRKKKRTRTFAEDVGEDNMKSTECNISNVTTPEVTNSSNCVTYELHENDCIDICDYSDSESCKIVSVEKNYDLDLSLRNSEFKTIQNVISVCLKKYLKKISIESVPHLSQHVPERQSDYSLKHKVLNIGRKVINNLGFSCIGILRYLEHQDLEIAWIPKVQNNIKKPDYVRIMIKLKDCNGNKHDLGWHKLENVNKDNFNSEIISPSITDKNSIKGLCESVNMISNNNTDTKEPSFKDFEEIEGKKSNYKVLKKLLNENPVLNPKQLSKKSQLPKDTNNRKTRNIVDQSVVNNVENNITSADVFQMPVITSTVSLAPVVEAKSQNELFEVPPNLTNQNINDGPYSPLDTMKNSPRIKVKPVTELMSDRVLSTLHKKQIYQDNNLNTNQNVNMIFQNTSFNDGYTSEMLTPNLNYPLEVDSRQNNSVTDTNDKREYVIMNTVDIPCQRTASPFRYLKDLLHINNIILLDVNEKMSQEFMCLLKFKLMFQQESNSPVVLCLALFYFNKRFCLKVKDLNKKEIDISRLSANWQWEILKVYRGDVVTKLLENAQKIGPEVCYMTSKFLCYLRSIDYRNEM